MSTCTAALPSQVASYAKPASQQYGVPISRLTTYVQTPQDLAQSEDLQQFSRLPGDCGVNTLRQVIAASGCQMESVHLIDVNKTAILRFDDAATLAQAMRLAAVPVGGASGGVFAVPDSLSCHAMQTVWPFAESNQKRDDLRRWVACSRTYAAHGPGAAPRRAAVLRGRVQARAGPPDQRAHG